MITTMTSEPVTTDERKRSFVLSKSIESIGYELTATQRIVLDVLQTLQAKFMHGGTGNVAMAERVCAEYHGLPFEEFRESLTELESAGILAWDLSQQGQRRLCCQLRFKGLPEDTQTPENAGIGELVETVDVAARNAAAVLVSRKRELPRRIAKLQDALKMFARAVR